MTPIVVDGVMYLASGNRVVALRPETGEEIWRHELAEGLASFRGVAYGPATDDHEARIYFTSLSKVIALKAATGERDAGFGDGGEAAVRIPYTGVPVVYDDTLILGSSAFGPGQRHIAPHLNQPRGGGEPTRAWPRALDGASGTLLWEFPTLPTESDFGSETWGNQSWRDRIGNNVWAFTLTVDEERGLVYMPVSSPGSNFYGGDRPGDNLFANSTIAIDIATGDLAWYFQNIHRELWDYNLPPSPGLMDIERDGEVVPALAQVGKSGWMFILNRVTGEPVHGVEERPVPVGDVPGEQYSPTQPFPLAPPPVSRVSMGPGDIVTADDTTPEHAAACRELWDTVGYYNDGPYTPIRYRQEGTPPSLVFPGTGGGVNWNGTAYDPGLGYIFVNSKDQPISGWMTENEEYGPRTSRTRWPSSARRARRSRPPSSTRPASASGPCPASSRRGRASSRSRRPPAPSRGRCRWASTSSCPRAGSGSGAATWAAPSPPAGGLVFIGATVDRRFRAFDSRTGEELWSAEFDYNVEAVPITYAGSDGRQYVAANVSAPASGEPQGERAAGGVRAAGRVGGGRPSVMTPR